MLVVVVVIGGLGADDINTGNDTGSDIVLGDLGRIEFRNLFSGRLVDHLASVLSTWEDAPFYARSALETTLFGERVEAVHESLSLTRFVSPIVQWMLPFRMPRRRR